jgi:hypothetical protein
VLVYATTGDLTTWTGATPPVNAVALLRSASMLVRRATMTAVYDVDIEGRPTNPAILGAFRDATCSQAATWAALGVDPVTGAAAGGKVASSKSLGSASVAYADAGLAAAARAKAATQLTTEALLILGDASLTGTPPQTIPRGMIQPPPWAIG